MRGKENKGSYLWLTRQKMSKNMYFHVKKPTYFIKMNYMLPNIYLMCYYICKQLIKIQLIKLIRKYNTIFDILQKRIYNNLLSNKIVKTTNYYMLLKQGRFGNI